jgi:hypothetical protein
VQATIDEAVEMLSRMPYTCSLDVVDALGEYEERTATNVGWILGVTRQAVALDEKRGQAKGRRVRHRSDTDEETGG